MKTYKAILFALLLFGVILNLSAQDKFEYALIRYHTVSGTANGVWVNYAGKDWELAGPIDHKEVISKSPFVSNYGVLLEHLRKMSAEGWEVISVGDGQVNYTLRRKIN